MKTIYNGDNNDIITSKTSQGWEETSLCMDHCFIRSYRFMTAICPHGQSQIWASYWWHQGYPYTRMGIKGSPTSWSVSQSDVRMTSVGMATKPVAVSTVLMSTKCEWCPYMDILHVINIKPIYGHIVVINLYDLIKQWSKTSEVASHPWGVLLVT